MDDAEFTHFYVFCLVSFVLYAFKYTASWMCWTPIVYWGNVVAGALQPALFLHFAVSFSDTWRRKTELYAPEGCWWQQLYAPGIFLIWLQYTAIHTLVGDRGFCNHRLDQIFSGLPRALLRDRGGGLPLAATSARRRPLERQQLKWLTRGTLLAVLPFTVFYVIPLPQPTARSQPC